MKNQRLWNFCKIGVGILLVLTFTPLVTPEGVYKPMLGGIPFTFWVGFLVSMLIVGITWLATKVHPGKDE